MRKCPMSLVIREMQFKITIKYKFTLFLLFSCKGHFCDSTNCSLPGSSVHRILNTGVACHFLLQGLFPTQGSNPYFLLGRQILYHWASWEALNTSISMITKKLHMIFKINSLKSYIPINTEVKKHCEQTGWRSLFQIFYFWPNFSGFIKSPF